MARRANGAPGWAAGLVPVVLAAALGAAGAAEKNVEKMAIPEKATIVFFGDSITHSGTVKNPEKRWPRLVEKRLRASGFDVTVIASGKPGQTTGPALGRFDKDVIARRPDLVFIEYGCNDFWKRDGRNHQTPPDKFEANLKEMIRRVRTRTKAHVVLIRNHARRYFMKAKAEGNYRYGDEDYGEAIAKVAAETKTPLLDMLGPFLAEAARWKELYHDSVHLAEPGSVLYAKIAGDWLEKRLVKGRPR